MRSFDYSRATTVNETVERLHGASDGRIRPLAGGTDLLPLMKQNIIAPVALIDIKRLENLSKEISEEEDELYLGALTSLSDIERSPLVAEHSPLLVQAAGLAATPQLRNMATIGGNLLQRPRCWYFRNELLPCWLKGGEDCPAFAGQNEFHALFGRGPCYAVHPSDLASALLAVDAAVELQSPAGRRSLSLAEFFQLPTNEHRCETVIKEDELLLAVRIPQQMAGARSVYLKAMDRKVWAFALAGVAAAVQIEAGKISSARLVLSGVAPIPWRVTAAEDVLEGKQPTIDLFAEAAQVALNDAIPLDDNGYKVPLLGGLIRRALAQVTGLTDVA